MDISNLFKRLRKVSLRKVGLYLTDLLTQLEGLQFTIKNSDLKDQLPPKFSENLVSTIEDIDRILFKIETSSANKYISEHKAEQLIADFQKMKRQTKKAYIDLGKYDQDLPPDQDLSDLLNKVKYALNQVPLSGQRKRTFNDADDSLTEVQLSQREPATM
ncbi:MAG: hypothetical protein AB4352_05165 [Hormoscilla sp.]